MLISPCFGRAFLGVRRGRAVDRAVTLRGRMKRGSRPNKVNAICSLANLMTFWAADLIRHNLRSPAREAAQKDVAPSSSTSSLEQAYPLLSIPLHYTKPLLHASSVILRVSSVILHDGSVIQMGPEIQVMLLPLFVPASSRWILISQFDLLSVLITTPNTKSCLT